MPKVLPDASMRDDLAFNALIANYGDAAISHVTDEIRDAVRRDDESAVTALDRMLRRLEAVERAPRNEGR